MATDQERLKKLQDKIARKQKIEDAKKARDKAIADYKKARGK